MSAATAATLVVAVVFLVGCYRTDRGHADGLAVMLLALVLLVGLVCWFPAVPAVPA